MSDEKIESWQDDVAFALMRVRAVFAPRPIEHLRFYLQRAFENLKSHYEDNDMDFWETIYDVAKYWLGGTYPDISPVEKAIHAELVAFIRQIPSWQLLAKSDESDSDLRVLLELGAQSIYLDEVMQHLTMAERHERNVKLHIRVLLYALEHKPTHRAIEDYIHFLEEDYEDWKMRTKHIHSSHLQHLIYAFSYDASWIPLAAAWKQRQRRRQRSNDDNLSSASAAKRPKLRLRF